ncbi:menaquinone biosynthesis protein [Thermoproteota archaeon]
MGRISFTHNDPAFYYFEKNRFDDVKIISATPKELMLKVIAGKLDIAPVASTSLITHERELKLVKAMSVHSVGQTLSSIVVSNGKTSLKSGDTIAVTNDTETSIMMLKIILERKGIKADFVINTKTDTKDLLSEAPFALTIGDDALRSKINGYNIIYDIGEEWWNLTHTPSVYAVTVTNSELIQREPERIKQAIKILSEAVKYREESFDEVALQASTRMNLPIEFFLEYFQIINLDFNANVEKGLKSFKIEGKKMNLF